MPDPRLQGLQHDPVARAAEDASAIRRRVAAAERQPRVQVGSGAPTNAVRDGTLYVDTTGSRLYVRVAGAWKSTALT